MNNEELLKKADSDEEMTFEEIVAYQKLVIPKVHTYGKYGNLAKQYLEEHKVAKYWLLAGDLPEYLHNIDKQASEMYDTINERLSKSEQFKKTGNYLKDLQLETEKQKIIEEEILNELVYTEV